MINKIIWTKSILDINYNQLDFALPSGYKIYTPTNTSISNKTYTCIKLGITIYTEEPITLVYTKAIHSFDFEIVNPLQLIPSKTSVELFLDLINPVYTEKEELWDIKAGSLIATMIPLLTSYNNLFEVSNKVFKNYA
jgi:hypothetical protein